MDTDRLLRDMAIFFGACAIPWTFPLIVLLWFGIEELRYRLSRLWHKLWAKGQGSGALNELNEQQPQQQRLPVAVTPKPSQKLPEPAPSLPETRKLSNRSSLSLEANAWVSKPGPYFPLQGSDLDGVMVEGNACKGTAFYNFRTRAKITAIRRQRLEEDLPGLEVDGCTSRGQAFYPPMPRRPIRRN
jgi:hypothetical protein